MVSNEVVHSGLPRKNGRYHTFRSIREEPRVKLHRNAKTTVRPSRRDRRTGPDRQRQRLRVGGLRTRRAALARPADPKPTPAPADQWQGRTLHPDADSGGVRRVVSPLLPPHPRLAPLAPTRQPRAASRRTRISTTVRPLPQGRPMINLVRTHNRVDNARRAATGGLVGPEGRSISCCTCPSSLSSSARGSSWP